jgi:phenylpropionate dioxygenase-like ring-hydroxylating dioxygenase large terminal subunit
MRQEEQIALIQRALALIDRHGSERGDPAVSPVSRYLDAARHQRELELVFRRHPVALCPSAALARAGDTLALDAAGLPLLIVRGDDGRIGAFVNACRHRGARLAPPGAAHRRALVCPYHSWTYALDGTLRGRPHGEDFAHLPPADCTLARVPAAEALGLVWVVPRIIDHEAEAALDIAA